MGFSHKMCKFFSVHNSLIGEIVNLLSFDAFNGELPLSVGLSADEVRNKFIGNCCFSVS